MFESRSADRPLDGPDYAIFPLDNGNAFGGVNPRTLEAFLVVLTHDHILVAPSREALVQMREKLLELNADNSLGTVVEMADAILAESNPDTSSLVQ